MALAHKRNMLNGFHQTDGVLSQPNEHHFDEQRGNSLPVEHFDYTGMDSIEDRAREALEVKGGIEKLVAELAEEFADDRASCAIGKLVCLIADHHEPKLAIACLALTAGMNTDDGIGGAAIARKFNVSKQAVSQYAIKLRTALGLNPARGQRPLAARQNMAAAYRARHGAPAKSALTK